ncbi:MAG TPA: ATP-binding protein [Solirubrobacteraceae bacterium]|nr:ATP-binding protein [Solirubrobacteraceae bacterium]
MLIEFALNAHPTAPARARSRLDALRPAVTPRILDDLRIVISELVANSVKYGPGQPITVRVRVEGPTVVHGEVEDQGKAHEPPVVKLRRGGPGGGYGLNLVDRLSARWGVREGSTHVWFVLDHGAA